MGILDGKAAVVTGGGRGIGRGHCLHLAANGASVVVNDIDQGEAAKVADEITKEGGRASTSTADISSREGAAAHPVKIRTRGRPRRRLGFGIRDGGFAATRACDR